MDRDANSSVCVASSTVSRRHARMLVADDRAAVEDLGNTNGTFVNEQRIDSAVSLKDGDEIRVGCTQRWPATN
jgi:pSer/pThr/pTyr-binding forkhead associated (FHA) protein